MILILLVLGFIILAAILVTVKIGDKRKRRDSDVRYYAALLFSELSKNTPCITHNQEDMFCRENWFATDGDYSICLSPINKDGFRLEIYVAKSKKIGDFVFPDFSTFLSERMSDFREIKAQRHLDPRQGHLNRNPDSIPARRPSSNQHE